MTTDDKICSFMIIIAIVISFVSAAYLENHRMLEQAITHQCAYYHQETGDFTWLMEKKDDL